MTPMHYSDSRACIPLYAMTRYTVLFSTLLPMRGRATPRRSTRLMRGWGWGRVHLLAISDGRPRYVTAIPAGMAPYDLLRLPPLTQATSECEIFFNWRIGYETSQTIIDATPDKGIRSGNSRRKSSRESSQIAKNLLTIRQRSNKKKL